MLVTVERVRRPHWNTMWTHRQCAHQANLWLQQGEAMYAAQVAGVGTRDAAQRLGLSHTTAWRRLCWYIDTIVLPASYGLQQRSRLPLRGTRGCPRGRPASVIDQQPSHR